MISKFFLNSTEKLSKSCMELIILFCTKEPIAFAILPISSPRFNKRSGNIKFNSPSATRFKLFTASIIARTSFNTITIARIQKIIIKATISKLVFVNFVL